MTNEPKVEHEDSFFLDQEFAHKIALEKNRVQITIAYTGLQVCYYSASSMIANPPENLIYIHPDKILDFFTNTRLRLPTKLVFSEKDGKSEKNKEFLTSFLNTLELAKNKRNKLINSYIRRCRKLKLDFSDKPLRIFCLASRTTTVMQYSMKGIVKALQEKGYDVKLSIEENDMQMIGTIDCLKDFYKFNPHITININHMNNIYLSNDVINIVWWQDPMADLVDDSPIEFRENDITYALSPAIEEMLINKGAKNVKRQNFCIDTSIFIKKETEQRKKRVVFIGSSYINTILDIDNNAAQFIIYYERKFFNGDLISRKDVNKVGKRFGLDETLAMYYLNYLIRDTSVKWLCMQDIIPVEIYGRYWELDETVAPFFRGEIAHGKDVAKIYNTSSHALCCISFNIISQRFAEIAACACIPVVYDFRNDCLPPYWENDCLYYRTKTQLYDALRLECNVDAPKIANFYSYAGFANKIEENINQIKK